MMNRQRCETSSKKNEISWTQGILGKRDSEYAWPLDLYNISSFPTYVLLGRDGKVLFHGHSLYGLEGAISSELSKTRP